MMVQALLLLPRLVGTPPARLVGTPPHRAATRQFSAPGLRLGEDDGKTARGAEQLQTAMDNVQARCASVQMRSGTRDSDREKLLAAAVQRNGYALCYASAELKTDREVVLAAVQQYGYALEHASAELKADREVVLAAVQRNGDALRHASAELQEDDAILQVSNHIFAELDRLADRGQLKVLRTLASVQECGRQMNNCLADYNLAQCRRYILVKLDGDDGAPLAVGSFANGEWEEIRYANNGDARGGGNRACGRGSAALPPAKTEEVLGQFENAVLKRNLRWLERARAVLRFFKRVCVALLLFYCLRLER